MRMTTLLTFLLFGLLSHGIASPALAANQLKDHPSPYLAMHGDDPVDWMDWNAATLQTAQQANKPLFVSIGYYACHWCHVMHKESYIDPDVAKLLNQHFISIKVDRELNPVLDKRLIEFVQNTTGHAGWPLNVFLTPQGYPMAGTTYLPRDPFLKALQKLSGQWQSNHAKLKTEAKMLNERLAKRSQRNTTGGSLKNIAANQKNFVKQVLMNADTLQGGFGEQTKFPSMPQLHALLHLNRTLRDPEIDDFLKTTLDQMQSQGLYDAIGGGFFRYTVDPDWNTPHFEKMLYNNALMPILYLDAGRQYARDDYKATARATLDFLRNTMQQTVGTDSSAYIASLSAIDDKDVEGGFYLFQPDELATILNADEHALANRAWAMARTPQLDAGNLPLQTTALAQFSKKEQQALAGIRSKLHAWRKANRTLPQDDKLLAGWNGLVLAAFAHAYYDHEPVRTDSQALARFLSNLWDGRTLYRSAEKRLAGTLGDYAAVGWGLLQWGMVARDEQATKTGTAIVQTAWQQFYSERGWLEADNSLLPGDYYQVHIEDSPLPSPEALLLMATDLLPMGALRDQLTVKAEQVFAQSTTAVEDHPYGYATLIRLAVD